MGVSRSTTGVPAITAGEAASDLSFSLHKLRWLENEATLAVHMTDKKYHAPFLEIISICQQYAVTLRAAQAEAMRRKMARRAAV